MEVKKKTWQERLHDLEADGWKLLCRMNHPDDNKLLVLWNEKEGRYAVHYRSASVTRVTVGTNPLDVYTCPEPPCPPSGG